jgi:hypothetical protein
MPKDALEDKNKILSDDKDGFAIRHHKSVKDPRFANAFLRGNAALQ